MIKRGKKSQITTFIIIGLILLLSISGLWYLRVTETSGEVEDSGLEILEGILEAENNTDIGEEWEEVYSGSPPGVPNYPSPSEQDESQYSEENQQQANQENVQTESPGETEETIYCFDSDNGKYTSIKGFLDTESSGELFDYCYNNNSIVELFCEDNTNGSEIFDCEEGCENGICKCADNGDCETGYFCDNGNCKSKCQDSDMGLNYGVFGEVFVIVNSSENYTVNDFCKEDNITLNEQYCYFGEAGFQEQSCYFGCQDGKCVSCEDSDGGSMYYVKGNGSLGDNFTEDYCLDENTLMESYCGVGGLFEEEYNCTRGCENGSCVSCMELNENEKIFAGGVVNESEIQINLWDNAAEDGDVVDVIFNNDLIDINYSLLNDGKIYNLSLIEGINKFTAIDVETPEGKNSWPPGKVLTAAAEIIGGNGEQPSFRMDESTQSRTLIIYYHENATPEMIIDGGEEDPLESACNMLDLVGEGEIEEETEEESLSPCLDSDVDEAHPRGKNPEVKGNLFVAYDNCLNESYLQEWYCDNDGNANYDNTIYCSGGCEDGACI